MNYLQKLIFLFFPILFLMYYIPNSRNVINLIRSDRQLIKKWVFQNQSSAVLEMPNLPAGIYSLRNENAEGMESRKLIKEDRI